MEDIQIKRIEDLLKYEIDHLIEESTKERFNFLIKLINEYESKRNIFSKTGECLYGIFRGDTLIGIQDPYTKDNKIGRLRRFYIAKDYRRKGLGRLLLGRILSDAKIYFTIVVLHTDTEQGDQFYTSSGFAKGKMYVGTSHYLNLDKRM
ncbi:GNAT family N-acetyltransferase [Bacillus nitratireducens]|uniref:GNAT family N-acetyltransferase n=1 Tax=Bacillus nitratireducens TaxID=2026193 RepID=UPI000BED33A8|nr:GNAT family N-acetyltransferase [Bacillus nitratireducens]PEE18930.1 GNAT family N-acetyltransferase [Bacillus cereus]MED0905772.1 GNAT family N-acetyltransferase [Bacillus nitratireducens]PFH91830.1 GNAT family N-acetyltransferase [Bacillus cereus]PFM56412.1 GNAT family N-acetyltransferase [Bacillus cereus]PFS19014.1 GNAT family N-acetyltransferase [Bacillus cereus]